MAHVLIADDNPLSLHFFSESITLAGHEATLAEDGTAALSLADKQSFDLILLDARMPGLDGSSVLHAIRSEGQRNRMTPALLTTAEASANRNALIAMGFAEVLYKPIGVAALHASLGRHLTDSANTGTLLDDAMAAETTGGNASIIAALRGLFAGELDALAEELDQFAASSDYPGLLDRLHRLDASAGFCGAPALTKSIKVLRAQVHAGKDWPTSAIANFLRTCMQTRAALP
ncbi:MAG TPA: response regulator [Dokdonella sp.]|uniref:response regulator n=1 Tax=Dokdonella sp. TaxID=2291710 RepID=UPI002D7EFF67|nr:response regulator [Dokdonella sp.]HET9032524.1 response regulator [Dokdonella sp.]